MNNTISDLITQPWTTYVLFAAVRLKVFTILADREMTVDEIAGTCGAVPRLLKPLLDVCVNMELIALNDGRYRNTETSRVHLVEGSPLYAGDMIDLLNMESKQWFRLPDIITGKRETGEPPPPDNVDQGTFIRAMNILGMLGEAEALMNAVDLTGCREMIDAGGGSGLYSIFLCRKHPDLRSTILDVKESLIAAKEITGEYRERERIQFREADIVRDAFGENVDAVLLSDVIYGESEAKAVLKNAWDCLKPGGILIVRGYYADPEKKNRLFSSLFTLNLLSSNPDREVLNVNSLTQCVKDAGFDQVEVSTLTERSICIIARKL